MGSRETRVVSRKPVRKSMGSCPVLRSSLRSGLLGAILIAVGASGPAHAQPIRVGNPGFNDVYTDSTMASKVSLTSWTLSLQNPYYVGFWTQTTPAWNYWCGVNPDYQVYMNTMGGRSQIEQVLPDLLRPGSYAFAVKVYRTDGPFAVNVSADLAVGNTVLTPDTSSSTEPDLGTNTLWTRTYSIATTNPLVGYPLKIRLGAGDSVMGEQRQVAFDDVSLAWLTPTIVAFTLTNQTIALDLKYLIPSATTTVQRAHSLTPADWSNVQSFVTSQAATNWTEQVDGGWQRVFYRTVSQY